MRKNKNLSTFKKFMIGITKHQKEEKKKILDEFCTVCNYNRKYAIRILNKFPFKEINKQNKRAGPKKKYDTPGVIKFIKTIRKKTNLICSKRLKAAIPIWLPLYKKHIPVIKTDEALNITGIDRQAA